jgi:hypothetical protein
MSLTDMIKLYFCILRKGRQLACPVFYTTTQ